MPYFKNLLFFLLIPFLTFSQNKNCECYLHGDVLDNSTKEPIVGAVVFIKELNKGTTTDEKGHYHIKDICQGNYTVIARIVGYKEEHFSVKIDHVSEAKFKLSEEDLHFENINIKAKRTESPTQTKNTLEDEALDKTRGESLGESLKSISGVTTLQTGSSISKPVIHGMHSNRILILNNGVRQEGQQWGSEHAPEIDPFVATKVSVIKGAMGVRYGSDAIAGVVMVEPNDLPDSAKITGEINSVYFTNGRQFVESGILQGGIPKIKGLAWRVQGTLKKGGDVSTPNYNLVNTGVEEQNFSFTLGYNRPKAGIEAFVSQFNTKIGIFTGSHIGNTTDLLAAIERGRPLDIYTPLAFSYTIDRPYQDVQHNLWKLKTYFRTENGQKLTLTLARQCDSRSEVDILRGDRDLIQSFLLTSYSGELIFDHKPLFKGITGMLGLSGNYQENLTTGSNISMPQISTVLIPNYKNLNSGVFAIERFVKNKWEFEAGVRYDYRDLNVYYIPRGSSQVVHNQRLNNNFSGTIGTDFHINSKLVLRANVASAWRAASVNELYSDGVHHGSATYEKGDTALLPEVALNASLTAEYVSKNFSAEVHLYNNSIQNFIFESPTGRTVLTIRGAFPEFWFTQANAVFRGLDLTTNYQFKQNFSWLAKYSFVHAQDLTHDQPLILIPPNRFENTLKYEFEKSKTTISLTNLFVAKQNRVPSKLIFDIPSSEIQFASNGGDFAPPPPAYFLWSASIGKQFSITNRQSLSVNITCTNLLNTAYRDYLNRFRYFSDEMGRNVALRVKYNF